MAIANKEGIVVSADWRLTRHRIDNPFIAMPSDHSQKAYITNTNHVVAFTGDARLGTGEFLNDVILHTLKITSAQKMPIQEELGFLLNVLVQKIGNSTVYLIECGIENGKNVMLRADTGHNKIQPNTLDDIGYAASGEHKLYQSKLIELGDNIHTLKLQEMIKFLQNTNYEIAEIDSLVSPKCDIITITYDGAHRLYTPERYGWIVDP
nr:MAG TPA: Proteasome subunit alpha type-2 [Bacteriophage sp.]